MKEINQLIHITDEFEKLKSILTNGLYTSYAKETFANRSLLIPMISFSNILFRDLGEEEVVDYGSYGIVIERDYGINELKLNPVIYVYEDSVIESAIKDNLQFSILPQTLEFIKEFYKNCNCDEITKFINFNPLPSEIKDLINNVDSNTKSELIIAIKKTFEKIFENSQNQFLLAKPFKVKRNNNDVKIAYNEREWRKSFFDLSYIYELDAKGQKNEDFILWKNLKKPHFKDIEHTLKIPIDKIKYIFVKDENEIELLKTDINLLSNNENLIIDTLENLKNTEIQIK